MVSLVFGGATMGGALLTPATSAEMFFTGSGILRELRLVDFSAGVTSRFALAGGALGVLLGQSSHATARTGIVAGDFYGSVVSDVLLAALVPDRPGSVTAYLKTGAEFATRVELLGAVIAGQTVLVAAESAGSGFSLFSVGAGSALTQISETEDTGATYATGVAAMATATIAGRTFLLTGSAQESGVSCYELLAGGQAVARGSLGVNEAVPVQGVSALQSVVVAGETYILVGSTTNSALTVLRLSADGSLSAADHLVDDLFTRFAGVTALATLTVGGRVFAVAGGTDNGISLFTLLPGGQLLHLQTLADSAAVTLAAPSAIAMTLVGAEIQVFVTSGTEAGLTLYRIDISTLGLTLAQGGTPNGGVGDDLLALTGGDGVLSGGAGSDILRDGTANDELIGGSGKDTFVLTADGHADTIFDFELGKDRIDLTLLPYLRNLQQLRFTPIAGGIVIQYGTELLTVLTADGRSLTAADFPATMLLPATRFPVAPGVPDPAGQAPFAPLVRQGTAYADSLAGTAGSDFLNGMAGNDTLFASAGADRFDGGTGVDGVSYAGLAAFTIDLAQQDLNSGSATGHAFVSVENITGSAFDDLIRLDSADNDAVGADGNDTLDGGAGRDTLSGGRGDDDIRGQDGDDRIDAGSGRDRVDAGPGNDFADLSDGDDTGTGAAGDDTLLGGDGHDLLSGGEGQDSLDGGDGNDTIAGGSGDDTILGGLGDDAANGGSGHDRIDGGAGNDLILGFSGRDTLFGGDGGDTLIGGTEDDRLTGGAGADVFLFESFRAGESDAITDFADGLDRLWLRGVPGPDDAARFGSLAITQVAQGTVIAYAGHAILLTGVLSGALDGGDIVFV